MPRTLHATRGFAADLLADLKVGGACLRTALVVVWIDYYELLFYLLPLADNYMLFILSSVTVSFKVLVCVNISALSISLGLTEGKLARTLARLLYYAHADEQLLEPSLCDEEAD